MATAVTDRHNTSGEDAPSGSARCARARAPGVLRARYLKKDEAGRVTETPEELFTRVARTIADIELRHGASEADRDQWQERFYDLMMAGRFMPNSPTLMNAGREMGMLSACFVLPVRRQH